MKTIQSTEELMQLLKDASRQVRRLTKRTDVGFLVVLHAVGLKQTVVAGSYESKDLGRLLRAAADDADHAEQHGVMPDEPEA